MLASCQGIPQLKQLNKPLMRALEAMAWEISYGYQVLNPQVGSSRHVDLEARISLYRDGAEISAGNAIALTGTEQPGLKRVLISGAP